MTGLHLDHFMRASEDYEGTQYRILSGLQQVRQAFSRTIIYPHLGALIDLHATLQTVVQQLVRVRAAMLATHRAEHAGTSMVPSATPELGLDEMALVEDMIRWAMPQLQEAIDEGKTVYEFVEEHLCMEEVGIVPSYMQEGYLIVPDGKERQTHVMQYMLSVFTRSDERFRSLKTTYVKSLPTQSIHRSPQSIKLELIAENKALPNPATYFFSTDLDFPFEPTTLPIAKRKLMHYLTQQSGVA